MSASAWQGQRCRLGRWAGYFVRKAAFESASCTPKPEFESRWASQRRRQGQPAAWAPRAAKKGGSAREKWTSSRKTSKTIQPTEPRQNRLAGAHNRHFLFEKLNILILFNRKSGFCAPARRLCRGAVGCMVFRRFYRRSAFFHRACRLFSARGPPGGARPPPPAV